ncbi:MAG TPA: MmpS family transport accessory protein [Pseudonocardiaceae bacterium]|nr:MmpS family transport accessory protein [Pseudonocardiaceae bacterium]
MSYPTMPSTPTQQEPARPPRNGLGTTGFVLGLIGLIFSPIPIVGVVAWPLVILGVIFSAIGIARTRSGAATNKGLSIAGLVLSVIGLVVCILWVAVIGKAASDVVNQANKTITISYDAGGDAKGATVDYSTFSNGSFSDSTNPVTLPWHKQVQASGFASGGTLTVSAGESGGTVSCKVTVDGVVKNQESATGPFAVANCSNF